jgi:oxygen-independent coproporphyrinogen III oxidase
MNDMLRHLLAAPVPRYTSYPTAVQFTPEITAETYSGWLETLETSEPVSLYVHIPFCRKLCHYCGCNTNIVARYEPVEDFLDVLEQELALATVYPRGRLTYRHLHFGGGTPTILTTEHFRRLCRSIDHHFVRGVDAELAVEVDPRTLSEDMAYALADSGVNRASLGVQDLDHAVQVAINRVQPFETVAAAAAHLRRVGISALNFDLIYGLPLQTVPGFLATVDRAAALAPSRIALFGYAHVPWMKRHQKLLERYEMPDGDLREELSRRAAERLQEHGYVAIGIDHFALPEDPLARAAANGSLRRNFQGYTTDDSPALLAFGPSGISRVPQGYAQADASVRGWRKAVSAGRLPVVRGVKLSAGDRLRADVIEMLMCRSVADLQAAAHRHGAGAPKEIFSSELIMLRPFVEAGVASLSGDRLAITDAGRLYARLVAAVFDQYLRRDSARHSRAV